MGCWSTDVSPTLRHITLHAFCTSSWCCIIAKVNKAGRLLMVFCSLFGTSGCFTTLAELPNIRFHDLHFWGCKRILLSVVHFMLEIKWRLFHINDAEMSSKFWNKSCCKSAIMWAHHPLIYNLTKSQVGNSPTVVKHPHTLATAIMTPVGLHRCVPF